MGVFVDLEKEMDTEVEVRVEVEVQVGARRSSCIEVAENSAQGLH